jgi:hypothetical protein
MDKIFILQEIRRITEANDGKPPGFGQFKVETGIRLTLYDLTKFEWDSWGDATEEAVGRRNRFGSVPYGETELLAKYAALARELGRLPTEPSLQRKRRSDPTFPSQVTFRSNLGNMPELVRRLLDYCRSQDGFEDVIRMCEQYVPRKQEVPDESRDSEEQLGFVYLMKSGKYYKIGRSEDVEVRRYNIGLKLPEKPHLIHKIRTDDPSGIEAYWHKRFETKRKNGEWFDLKREDVAAFKRRRFM